MDSKNSNSSHIDQGEIICPACAEEVLSAFCQYLKETKEEEKNFDYLDWANWRPFWSQVNLMSERTRKCAQEWQGKIGEKAKEKSKEGKFPKEYPILSNNKILKNIDELMNDVQNNRHNKIKDLVIFQPFDDEIEEKCRGYLAKVKIEAQKVVNKVMEDIFPADLEHIQEALSATRDIGIENFPTENVGNNQTTLIEDADVGKFIDNMISMLKLEMIETLLQLSVLDKSLEEREKILFETSDQRKNKLLSGEIDEEQKKLGEGARRIVAALYRQQESKDIKEIVKEISNKIVERKKKKPVTPAIVLIGGGGAAGKTTFTKKLTVRLETVGEKVGKLDLDNYFLPKELIGNRASDGKYDNPRNSDLQRAKHNIEAIKEGAEPKVPVHDRKEHKLSQQESDDKNKYIKDSVVIVEGLYTLCPMLYSLGDVTIYIDASPLDRAKGRVWRDINIRKRDERHVVEMLLGRETYHQTFVEPTQAVADFIVRRSSTSGVLRVVDDDELAECIERACKIIKIVDKSDELTFELLKLLDNLNKRRAAQTEF